MDALRTLRRDGREVTPLKGVTCGGPTAPNTTHRSLRATFDSQNGFLILFAALQEAQDLINLVITQPQESAENSFTISEIAKGAVDVG